MLPSPKELPNSRLYNQEIGFALLLICLTLSGCISLLLGSDANWDLKNYHIYNPWALLHHRWQIDLWVADIQTYFHPVLDLLYYFLSFHWFPNSPRVVAFLMGLPYGLLVFLTTRITWIVLLDFQLTFIQRSIFSLFAVGLGVTGSAVVPQIGTTFNEIQPAVLMLAGLLLLLKSQSKIHLVIAGLLFGLAAGLKLTACIYAPAAALSIFTVTATWRHAIKNTLLFCLAWLVGFLLLYGWWGWHLYTSTGNPFYPYFNQLFHSPWFPNAKGLDDRFWPRTWMQTIFYPFFWARNNAGLVTEVPFADPRFSLGLVATVYLIIKSCWVSIQIKNKQPLPTSALFILVFISIAYPTWEYIFSIFRYTVCIEVLMGLLIVIALLSFFTTPKQRIFALIIAVSLFTITTINTIYPQWGRVDYQQKLSNMSPVSIPKHSLIILLEKPLAYVIPTMIQQNKDITFVGLLGLVLDMRGKLLWESVAKKIRQHQGPIYVLWREDNQSMQTVLPEFGLWVDASCNTTFSMFNDLNLHLCPAARI